MTEFPEDSFPQPDYSTPAARYARALNRERKLDTIARAGLQFVCGMAEQRRETLADTLAVVDAFDRLSRSVRQSVAMAAKHAADTTVLAAALFDAPSK